MVKINLKNTDPLPDGEKKKSPTGKPDSPMKRSREIPRKESPAEFGAEEDISSALEAQLQGEVSEMQEEAPAESVEAKSSKFKFRDQEPLPEMDDTFGSYGRGSKKGLIILLLVIFILAAGGFAVFRFTNLFSSGIPFFSKSSIKVATPQPETEKTAAPIPGAELPPIFAGILANNQFLGGHFRQMISNTSPSGRYSLIVISPGEINLTVLSDSREKAAQFRGDLNKLFPALNFRTIASQTKVINNASLVFTDMTAKVNPDAIPPYSGSTPPARPVGDLQREIGSLTAKYKLRLDSFKAGKKFDSGTYWEDYHYVIVTGGKENLLEFLQELTSSPSIGLRKLHSNPTNLVTFSDKNLTARLNISLIHLK